MAFNLKKISQKAKDSVSPHSVVLPQHAQKYNLSLSDKSYVPNFNSILEEDRRPIDNPVTHEAMLDENRKKAAHNDKTIEGALGDADSKLYPHRQHEDGTRGGVTPAAALSEAFDRKYRDAFAKANNDPDTAFWDKYVGDQLDGPITKVPNNVPQRGSQLQANPDRFGNLDGLPHHSSAEKNRDNFGKKVEVDAMHGFKGGEKALKMALSSMRDADKLLYHTYLQAAKENRALNAEETDLVNGITKDKQAFLLTIAQTSAIPPQEGNIPPEDRDTDFLNGNDPTAGDERLWAEQSGFDPSALEGAAEQSDPSGMTGADPMGTDPMGGDGSGAPGMGELPTSEGDISMDTGEPMGDVPEMGSTIPPAPSATNTADGQPTLAEPTFNHDPFGAGVGEQPPSEGTPSAASPPAPATPPPAPGAQSSNYFSLDTPEQPAPAPAPQPKPLGGGPSAPPTI